QPLHYRDAIRLPGYLFTRWLRLRLRRRCAASDAGQRERTGRAAVAAAGRGLVVRALRVLGDVDAVDLDLRLGPETDRVLDHQAEHERHAERVERHDAARLELRQQLVRAAADEETLALAEAVADERVRRGAGEQADPQRADPATDEVDRDHVERVVEAQLVLDGDAERTHDARDEADQHRRVRID